MLLVLILNYLDLKACGNQLSALTYPVIFFDTLLMSSFKFLNSSSVLVIRCP